MSRWIRFAIAILIGASIAMIYGWMINPVEYVDTGINSLRIDYKTDYVLMVAEAYQSEEDLSIVSKRLAYLGSKSPADVVSQAILFANKAGYTDADIQLLVSLQEDLKSYHAIIETSSP